MARSPKTSRHGKHYRDKNPEDPVALFCAEALRRFEKFGGNAAALADKLGVSKAAVSHWAAGTSHPKLENLTALSLASNLSLGYLTSLAAVQTSDPPQQLGEIEARYNLLPDMLKPSVISALDDAERTRDSLPPEAWTQAVSNDRLDPDWRNPDHRPKQQK